MDNNNNYEQQFIQNVKQSTTPVVPASSSMSSGNPESSSKLPLIIAIILACALLIESIVLVFFATRSVSPSAEVEQDTSDIPEDTPEALSDASNFTFDENFAITAFNLTCTNENGTKYVFDKSNTYQKINSATTPIDSGSYSIVNSAAVVLNNSQNAEEVIYYDGYYVIDGLTFYECEEQ